ncbi:MAG: monovalent cation/H+ antiporter complex subunit F [Bryobacterales bacterium]|nr:monovalent cation/H+ antiporter complex subunit F [Bryobacteraceae bacterium]MDW8356055.1 monovalent cation/H+ antiporter complex subunit F [Bryobacterales bacterium]
MTETVAGVVLVVLAAALLLAVGRLIRGPSLPDRVVALDLMATIGVAMMAVESLLARQIAMLDAGIVVALVAFLGTVAFAHYLERGGGR